MQGLGRLHGSVEKSACYSNYGDLWSEIERRLLVAWSLRREGVREGCTAGRAVHSPVPGQLSWGPRLIEQHNIAYECTKHNSIENTQNYLPTSYWLVYWTSKSQMTMNNQKTILFSATCVTCVLVRRQGVRPGSSQSVMECQLMVAMPSLPLTKSRLFHEMSKYYLTF